MDNLMTSFYNMTSTVVPVVSEQAGNLATGAQMLAEGASTAIASVSQWSSGSEDATASAEVFSWEQRPEDRLAELEEQRKKREERNEQPTNSEQPGGAAAAADDANDEIMTTTTSSANTSIEWDVVKEDVLAKEVAEHNKFVMVQNSYEWAKNWK